MDRHVLTSLIPVVPHGINCGARSVAAALGLVADPREERHSMMKPGDPRSRVPPGYRLWRQRLLGR
jgi:hypothetical protein